MKRASIFIGLKLTEITAVIFIPYLLGQLVEKWPWYYNYMEFSTVPYWIAGLITIILVFGVVLGVVLAVWLLALIFRSNWDLSKKIENKIAK